MGLPRTNLDDLRIERRGAEEKRSRLWPWVLLILLVLGFGLGAGRLLRKPVAVSTLTVRSSGAPKEQTLLNASGYVVARREATVSSKVTGKVVEVLVEEGMRVAEGQVLARLDASNAQTSLDLAEAQLNSARSGLAETRVRLHEADLEFQRVSGLATNRVSSVSDLDHAEAEFHALQAHLVQQEADVHVAERQVNLWRQQLDDLVIRAPFSGIVVSKNAQPGEMISPISAGGGFTRTGICTLVDMQSLEVEVDVNESYINRVREGQPVEAVLDAYPDWKIPSKVKAIIPTADRQKATVKVRVVFDQLDPRMLPEMGVKVAFRAEGQSSSPHTGLPVPQTAVLEERGRTIVFVYEDGRVERRAVKVAGTDGDQVWVVAGLAPGEKVIDKAPKNLKDGDRVRELAP